MPNNQAQRADIATRWQPGKSGNSAGPLRLRWLRERLTKAARDGDKSAMEKIADHLIEVATKWEVIVIGYDREAKEPIRVASGRDSVAAAQVLWQYALGKPPPSSEDGRLALAEHIRKVARDQAELSLAALGNRINAMSDAEKVAFFEMCSTDPAKYLRAAEAELAEREQRIAIDAVPRDSVGPVAESETAASPPAAQSEVPPCAANGAPPEAGAFGDGEAFP